MDSKKVKLKVEFSQLNARLTELSGIMYRIETGISNLDEVEIGLLKRQYDVMKEYHDILMQRCINNNVDI